MKNPSRFLAARLTALAITIIALPSAFAALATCWHIPDNTSDLNFNMRNPEFAIGITTTVRFYSGIWKWNGGSQLCNQTGGTLYYKTTSQSSWNSANLSFYSNAKADGSTNNQYWQASLDCSQFNFNDTVQYFFLLKFDGTAGVTDTWLYGNNAGSSATGTSNTAAASPFTFAVTNIALAVNGLNADYTTTHCFVDEVAGNSFPLNIVFTPAAAGLSQVEIFSNVNRRDRAAMDINGDGIEDGIVAPDGNGIVANDGTNYYQAYTMNTTATPGQYMLTLNCTNTGAYRLTARYKVSGNTNWFWYSSNGRRDHAVVVTPKKARDIVLYELNTINVESQGQDLASRSTFTDLYDGPGSRAYNSTNTKFNLDYVANLGANWLWFQPIHPPGIDGRETDPATSLPYEVGSPYAVKNFFEVNPLMGKGNTRASAMQEFTNFVAAADARGIGIMLDAAFNHTAYDCELAASGVYYWGGVGNPGNWQPTDEIRNRESRVYSKSGDYCARATGTGDIASAPDRGDFGKWNDVKDVFFGRYAALVCQNPSDNGNYLNESDWMNTDAVTGNFDAVTRNVWRYYADYILYWLDKTGCPAGTPANQTSKGIDGLRADFGQGLPPQCWEYIINKTRARKWDFVFMSESLDGGAVTYRSNRHFDMLNENIVFSLKTAANTSDYRSIYESRRTSYGQGLVLLNITSHDEETYDDPFQMLVRHAVNGTIDGAPMIFYGQELGVARLFGFDRYELNFGKQIPHFKKFNSLQPILYPGNRTNGQDYLYPVYAAVNQARQFSRALRSSNRWFIDQTSGSAHTSIFSVAKYETANASPNQADVVFGFANLTRDFDQSGTFNVNITQNGQNLFGIKSNRTYNVKNIAAYTGYDANRRSVWLWNGGVGGTAGSNILANGIIVLMKKVPASDAGWTTAPYEAQYLKLYDVTPPPTPGTPAAPAAYVVGTNVTFAWSGVVDAEGGISGYHLLVGTSATASNVFNGTVAAISNTVSGSYGQTLYARVATVNNAGIESAFSAASSATILLDPNADSDGDGMINSAEVAAGTNPLDSASRLQILSLGADHLLTWSSVSGKTYTVMGTTTLVSNFSAVSGVITSTLPTTSYTDATATNQAKFYRVKLVP